MVVHLIVVLVVIVINLKSCLYISVYFRYLPVLHFISVPWIDAQYSLRSSAARRKHQAKWLTALATGGRTRVWSMMQNMKASCIKMWAGFLRLKPTWVTGVSLANHRGCTPVFCSRRLHSVYSLCSSEYSKICTHTQCLELVTCHFRAEKSKCVGHLLVSVNNDQVAACWVDSDGCGAGVVDWDGAVDLHTIESIYSLHLKCL